MGLDAYIYIDRSCERRAELREEINNVDVANTLKSIEALLTADTKESKRLSYALGVFIAHFGDDATVKLFDAIRDSLDDENIAIDPDCINMEQMAYFRALWFLNSYFDYGNDWYAKNKPVSKQQIETLKSLCDKVVTEVEEEKEKRGHLTNKECGDIARKILDDGDVWYYEVEQMKDMCEELLNEANWDTDKVYYNADW